MQVPVGSTTAPWPATWEDLHPPGAWGSARHWLDLDMTPADRDGPALGRPAAVGVALGVAGLGLALLLGAGARLDFAGLALAAIAGIYVGFAVGDGRPGIIALESAVACAFVAVALWGLTEDAHVVLGLGIVAHGVWDLAHHRGRPIRTRTAPWYPPFCLAIDVVVGVPLALGLMT
jgi:hypothetical protein